MLVPLLLQAVALFPVSEIPAEADPSFTARVRALAAKHSWPTAEVDVLRAECGRGPAAASLAALLEDGNDAELRLVALVAAGTKTPWLADALYAVGCSSSSEAAALACLLAPAEVPARWWPALLMRAQDSLAPLPVRAGAMARLLDGGCLEVWPFVRSVLRTGTALDEPAPWADWKRGGRYELPKRILMLSLDRLLKEVEGQPSGFEPNAAWEAQVRQLAALESRMQTLLDGPRLAESPLEDQAEIGALLELAATGDAAAGRALGILLSGNPLLRESVIRAHPDAASRIRAPR